MSSNETHPAGGMVTVSSRRLEYADARLLPEGRATEGGVVILLRGELDLATASVVDDELRRAEISQELILLDLRELSFMDSTGLRTVIEADRRVRAQGGSLVILQGSPQVRRLFELAGVANHLDVVDDLDRGEETNRRDAR